MSLAELAQRVRHDLACLSYPAKAWIPSRQRDGTPVLDVLIVGAGQAGLTLAFGLRLEQVTNIRLIDRAPRGAEGPWVTFARMATLRTPKSITGPDLGIPSLTPRAWWEARFGAASWERLDKMTPRQWQDYLDWYRETLALPVENETALRAIQPADGLLAAHLAGPRGEERVLTRKIVLATGIDGSGAWQTPALIRDHLPPARHAHAAEAIDFARLKGRHVTVLGAGASAFDNAGVALEAGARQVVLCLRRPDVPRVNPFLWTAFAGVLGQSHAMDDLMRWRFARQIIEGLPTPPPQDTFWRCRRFASFSLRADCAWHGLGMAGDGIRIETSDGGIATDFIIAATGVVTDLRLRPELAPFAERIALWRDRFTPPAGEESANVGAHPYLGPAFEFLEREPGTAPFLKDIHNFTFGTLPSHGLTGGAITGLRYGVPRLVQGLVRDLYLGDVGEHWRSLAGYDHRELASLDPPPDA